jgi:hypothetical protein
VAALVGSAALGRSARASADDVQDGSGASPSPLGVVDWHAPPGCPDAAYVNGKFSAFEHGESAPSGLTARADVSRASSGEWRVDLQLSGSSPGGRRSMAAVSCAALADAVALVVALAADARRHEAPVTTAPAPPAVSTPGDAAVPPESVPPEAPRAPSPQAMSASDEEGSPLRGRPKPPQPNFGLASGVFGDSGALASVGAGMAWTLTWFGGDEAPWIELGALLSGIVSSPRAAPQGTRLSLRAGSIGVCAGPRASRWRAGVCVDAELASLHGSVWSGGAPRSGDWAWPDLRARVTAAYDLAWRWAIRVDAGGGLGLDTPRFVRIGEATGPLTELDAPGQPRLRLAVGLEAHF